ncbi:glycerophosphodiester phosphodiesterase [bacterium]|nr:glycerophosphodiester phosphodiesterase [bacterium]
MNKAYQQSARLDALTSPVLIAHRGDKTRYPENTLAAFEAAVNAGAEMIELDISLSRDRSMVVIHDDTLERTTNGKGPVNERTLSELKKLDAGSWFDKQFAAERIPTLREVLEMVDRRALVNIEIKKSAFEASAPDDAIEKQLVVLLQEMELTDSVLISSFETRFLERIAALDSALALAAISTETADDSTVKSLQELGIYSWHGWYGILTTEIVKQLHDAGFRVFSFTINERVVFKDLMNMEVDGFFTDDCLLLRGALGNGGVHN